jgi:hypothetical protein
MNAGLRISNKDYRRNENLKILLPQVHRPFLFTASSAGFAERASLVREQLGADFACGKFVNRLM